MEPRVWIKGVTFSSNTVVNFESDDVVIIVGPNNSGKSATLRAIKDKSINSNSSSAVVKKIAVGKEGTSDDVIAWLRRTTKVTQEGTNSTFRGLNSAINSASVPGWWTGAEDSIAQIAPFFVHLLAADERLRAADPQANIALTVDPPTHPVHIIQRDDSLEMQLSRQFKKAFGQDIHVHRNAGNQVPILVGEKPRFKDGQDRVSLDYVRELEKLPRINTQGDGMRSFLGVLLYTTLGHETVLLVDEPEAFLHPPQARHLGNVLVSDVKPHCQLFVATHSGDVLRGALDAESTRVRVLRLTRPDETNVIHELKNSEIGRIWSDPLLRYSNILDGLFHERVVVCESDSDCRFYSAITDALIETSDNDQRRPDLMFTHCGGKARLPQAIRSLRELGVHTSVVTDFDVLNDERPLRDIVEAAGGDWNSIAFDWKQVKHAVDGKKPELSTDEVKREIENSLSLASGAMFPDATKKQIQAILKRSSPWANAKSVGVQFIPNGEASKACVRLLESLEGIGVYVVPVGELEGFAKSAGGHGPSWVAEVLKMDLKNNAGFDPAKQFVAKVIHLG